MMKKKGSKAGGKLSEMLKKKKSLTQMPGASKRQRRDVNMTRAQEKRLADEANQMRGEAQRGEDRMNMPSMMKKGGKVKKMSSGGAVGMYGESATEKQVKSKKPMAKKGYKKGGKIRGYGIARGGKVCKMR
tara:strand:- start:1830 stop:2222 length:393 start_codon:yes stop_codon:yes gene_type:complete